MPTARIWEIDFLRGIAIILMVIFHLVVDLNDFYGFTLEYLHGFWYYIGKLSAVLFILLSGLSSTLGRNAVRRGCYIFCWGLVITLVTYFYNPQTYIRFGILHLIGSSMILSRLFSRTKLWGLLFWGLSIILLGTYVDGIIVSTPYLIPFGLVPNDFASLDYYPLLPWFGLFLLGQLVGRTAYAAKTSLLLRTYRPNLLTRMGKRSLTVYLVHQPVLLLVLFVINKLYS